MKGHFKFPKAQALQDPHYHIVKCHISGHLLGGITPLQRFNWCITVLGEWARKKAIKRKRERKSKKERKKERERERERKRMRET